MKLGKHKEQTSRSAGRGGSRGISGIDRCDPDGVRGRPFARPLVPSPEVPSVSVPGGPSLWGS